MTAVLRPTDALHRAMGSMDDSQINYSSAPSQPVDWKAKYQQMADMLEETRNELQEFQTSSKELEDELERELERTEQAHQDLQIKVAKAENEREEWKSKFMQLQTTHNTTTTTLQRELDTLRQDHQKIKIQLRELEMGNDDLERNERAVTSSLADVEAKYSRALEEKILLEHELLDKATLEEECQRLKDDLRDANLEISVLRDQLVAAQSNASRASFHSTRSSVQDSIKSLSVTSQSDNFSTDSLLDNTPVPDMQLEDLFSSTMSTPPSSSPSKNMGTPRAKGLAASTRVTSRIPSSPSKSPSKRPTLGASLIGPPSGFSPANRSTTLPHLNLTNKTVKSTPPSRMRSPVSALYRPPAVSRAATGATTTSTSSTKSTSTSKSKQMLTDMRGRLNIIQQRIPITGRLRMGSITAKVNNDAITAANTASTKTASSSSTAAPAMKRTVSVQNNVFRTHTPVSARRSVDETAERRNNGNTDSGWVYLDVADSPSPGKEKAGARRRLSNPGPPNSFKAHQFLSLGTSAANTNNQELASPLAQKASSSAPRRPQSRLSGASLSTVATTSSIPTPISRPTTPTGIPLPSSALSYSGLSTSTIGGLGIKRTTGSVTAKTPVLSKRSSAGSHTSITTPSVPSFGGRQERTGAGGYAGSGGSPSRPASSAASSTSSSSRHDSMSSNFYGGHTYHPNVTMRVASTKVGSTGGLSSVLSKSRIGKPPSMSSGWKSADEFGS